MKTLMGIFAFHLVIFEGISHQKTYLPAIKRTFQSVSISNSTVSDFAVDKDVETCARAVSGPSPNDTAWWRVELDRIYVILQINIANNPNTSYVSFLSGLQVFISIDQNFETKLCSSVSQKNNREHSLTLTCKEPTAGRFITIKRIGGVRKKTLILCEVSIYIKSDSTAMTFNQPTSQSGILFLESSRLAVDGDMNTCTKVRAKKDDLAWWRIALDDYYDISGVLIYFRPNSSDAFTLNHFGIYTSRDAEDFQQEQCATFSDMTRPWVGLINLTCSRILSGNFLIIKKIGGYKPNWLIMCEVHIFGIGRTNRTCESDEMRCEIYAECFSKDQICDRIVECPDGSDESNCTCMWLEYKCLEGKCINKEWLCDGVKDCPYGDDEEVESCVTCQKGEFKCSKNNVCMSRQKHCDGIFDCPDKSDEHGCLELAGLNTRIQFLKATFKGEIGFHICATNWWDKYSLHACKEMGFNIHEATLYSTTNASKIIGLKANVHLKDNLPFMALFQKRNECDSGKFVRLLCPKILMEDCGTRGFSDSDLGPYIIQGDRAKYGAWPWHVQVIVIGEGFCGGSLIRNDLVLTAAHCVENVTNVEQINVIVGSNIKNDRMSKRHLVSQFVLHPDFVTGEKYNDVGLLKLSTPLPFTNAVRTICLPNKEMTIKKMTHFRYCVIAGFGFIADAFDDSRYLLQGKMNIMTHTKCIKNLANISDIDEEGALTTLDKYKVFCAGSPITKYGVNFCTGDSGSPLVCKNEHGRWTQVGVAAFTTYGRDREDCVTSLFVKVDQFLDFIIQNLNT